MRSDRLYWRLPHPHDCLSARCSLYFPAGPEARKVNQMKLRMRSYLQVVVTLALMSCLPGAAGGQDRQPKSRDVQPSRATLAIFGGMLIDGHGGTPIQQAVVLVDGNRIVAVGNRDTLAVPSGAQIVDAHGMTVMPGLIDVHVHHDLIGHTDYDRWFELYGDKLEQAITTHVRLMIMSGVTMTADLFGPPDILNRVRDRVNRGEIPGPRMKATMGAILNTPEKYVGREKFSWQVTTAKEAQAAAEQAVANHADLLNVMDGMTAEQIRAVADVARQHRLKVTGIASSPQDLIMRVNAGQQAVDHLMPLMGPNATLDPAALEALFRAQAYVCPTLVGGLGSSGSFAQLLGLQNPDYYINNRRMEMWTPPEMWAEVQASLRHPERVPYFSEGTHFREMREVGQVFKQLWDSGVRVLVGTDAGNTYNLPTESMWTEMDLMVRFGADPMEVITAATRRNAEWLGALDEVGTVTPGKLADIIVVDGNPLESMRELRHIVTVIKDGKIVRTAGNGSAGRSARR
jgi:imidazolonepropionase-like amidohydrolase